MKTFLLITNIQNYSSPPAWTSGGGDSVRTTTCLASARRCRCGGTCAWAGTPRRWKSGCCLQDTLRHWAAGAQIACTSRRSSLCSLSSAYELAALMRRSWRGHVRVHVTYSGRKAAFDRRCRRATSSLACVRARTCSDSNGRCLAADAALNGDGRRNGLSREDYAVRMGTACRRIGTTRWVGFGNGLSVATAGRLDRSVSYQG